MELRGAEEQLRRNLDILESIFARHEQFLEKFGSAIAKYIEVTEISKPLAEAAGAEIEAKGKASKRTVFGRSRRGRGKGLVQYLSEKTWALSMLIKYIGMERNEISVQARYLYPMLRETEFELKEEEQSERRLPKRIRAKLEKVEKLTKKCENILKKEARRDKKLAKLTQKEISSLEKAYSLSMREGIYARRLMSLFFAAHFYKKLMLTFQKEEIFFAKFMKEEVKAINGITRDIKDIFELIKEHEKIEKLIGGSPKRFKAEEKKEKKEAKVSKRLKKLMKKMENIQKHLEKIKKGAAKYGAEIGKNISLLSSEEKELLKEEKQMEEELSDIEILFENMNKFSQMISRFLNNLLISDIRLKPQLTWINHSLISAYKLAKKNPSGALTFLEKIANFAEKALVPALKNIDNERREIFKEFAGEEGVIKRLEKDMSLIYRLENDAFLKNLKKFDKSLIAIEKSVDAGTKKAIRDLKADINELKHSLKEEKEIVKEEAKAGAPKTAEEEAETKAKIAELEEKLKDLEKRHLEMKKEFTPAANDIRKAIKKAPRFKFAKGGFLASKIIKDISLAEHYLSEEEHEESIELSYLRKWFENKTNLDEYVNFVKVLINTFKEEGLMLARIFEYNQEMKLLEKDFAHDLRNAEFCMWDIERGIRKLEDVMQKYPDLFGEEERELFSELITTLNSTNKLVTDLKKAERAISVISSNSFTMEHSVKKAEENIKELEKMLKISEKNAKKASKFFGREVQAAF
ncbi:MAG: hypothetical protein J7K22_02070 [Nanoarchaeota archaeon]|nr:hypothetical protein [Nanoarchaeota archaeon]